MTYTEQAINIGKAEVDYLLEHQDDIPKEWREYYLIFPNYLQGGDGDGYVAYFDWPGERWRLDFVWLGNYFDRYTRFVRRRESTEDKSESSATWPLEELTINGVKYKRV